MFITIITLLVLKRLNYSFPTLLPFAFVFFIPHQRYDEIVTPYTTGYLLDDNPNVQNKLLQNWCSLDYSEHVLQMFDRKSYILLPSPQTSYMFCCSSFRLASN